MHTLLFHFPIFLLFEYTSENRNAHYHQVTDAYRAVHFWIDFMNNSQWTIQLIFLWLRFRSWLILVKPEFFGGMKSMGGFPEWVRSRTNKEWCICFIWIFICFPYLPCSKSDCELRNVNLYFLDFLNTSYIPIRLFDLLKNLIFNQNYSIRSKFYHKNTH